MKHTSFSSALLVILAAFVIVSCSKKDEPEPSMGDQVAGTYTLTKISLGPLGIEYPYTDPATGVKSSGKIEVTKSADDKVSATIIQTDTDKAGKSTDEKTALGEATLKKAATGEIEAYSGATKIGTYSNGVITLSAIDPTLGQVTIIGKK
ncbi:hypothetical protein [Runella sp.]|uniref:hypothetical protein n=1 Tax=Runella sp. TaxID=1960881 RepID=UPI003D0C3CC5